MTDQDLHNILDRLHDDFNMDYKKFNNVERMLMYTERARQVIWSFSFESPSSSRDSSLIFGVIVGEKKPSAKYDIGYGLYTCTFHESGSNVSMDTLKKVFTNKAVATIKSHFF